MPRAKSKAAAISLVKEKTVSTAQAKALAKKLSKDGKTYDEIAKEMAKQGINGSRSGKPLSISTLSSWLGSKPEKAEKIEKAAKVVKRQPQTSGKASSSDDHILTTIRAILEFKGMESGETLNLIRVLVKNV